MGTEVSADYEGVATATGMVRMEPQHDYSGGKSGFQSWLGVRMFKRLALQARSLDGEVSLQGCNGNPEVEDDWYTLDSLTADGRINVIDEPVHYARVNVTTLTSGTPSLFLSLEG